VSAIEELISTFAPSVTLDQSSAVLAYGLGVLAAGPLVAWTMHLVPVAPNRIDDGEWMGGHWHRGAFGFVERALVVTTVLIGSAELIAAWLILKVAMRWPGWSEEIGTYNRFMIGTALSIGTSACGALAALAVTDGGMIESVGLLATPLIASLFIITLYRGPRWWQRVWDPTATPEVADDESS
jgi:hypothetical protein